MFDLSKFMIGTGSDGEPEQGESIPQPLPRSKNIPKQEQNRIDGKTDSFQEHDNTKKRSPEIEKDVEASDWSDGEEASGDLAKDWLRINQTNIENKCQVEELEVSNWSDGADSFKLEKHAQTQSDKKEIVKDDPESPVWSDDDLQSWSSNKNQNIVPMPKQTSPDQTLCQKDSQCEENPSQFNPINTSPFLFGKSKTLSEEMSEDSYKPVKSMANIPTVSQTIPKYSSPEQSHFSRPLPRVSKTDNNPRRKITTVRKSNIDRRIERLRKKVDDLETCSEALTDSDYTDIDTSDSESSDTSDLQINPKTPTKSEKLKSFVHKERLKKRNMKRIVLKLKEQKKKQGEFIDNLITRNMLLDKDLTESQSWLNQSHMKCELSQENLKSVKCLRGNLMDEIENQNSNLLNKMTEINQLEIKLKETQIENGFLHETIEKYSHQNHDNSEDMIKLRIEEAKSETEAEFRNKITELEQAYLEKEQLREEDHLNELQCKETDYKSQIETLRDKQKSVLSNMESDNSSILQDLKSEKVKHDSLKSNIIQLETENSDLKAKLEEYLSKNKLLESNLDEKIQEISNLQVETKNIETVDSLKAQFSHMADMYEKKIERLEEDIETNAEKLSQEINSNTTQLRDKDELINHLKKDLGVIRQDYEERMQLSEAQFITERETLCQRMDVMEQSKLNYEKEISRLEKELQDQSEQLQVDIRLSEKLEGKTKECEDVGKELLTMKEEMGALVDENQSLRENIQSSKQIEEEKGEEKEKINSRLVHCCSPYTSVFCESLHHFLDNETFVLDCYQGLIKIYSIYWKRKKRSLNWSVLT